VTWIRKSADQGDADGEAELAVTYEFGWGVNKDYVETLSGSTSLQSRAMRAANATSA
jgi:TPR repeat protein